MTIRGNNMMNTFDIKTVADAATELTRNTAQTLTDANTKAWKDFYAFGNTVAKAQADVFKGLTTAQGYGDIYAAMTKAQTEAVKAMGNWANMLQGTGTSSK